MLDADVFSTDLVFALAVLPQTDIPPSLPPFPLFPSSSSVSGRGHSAEESDRHGHDPVLARAGHVLRGPKSRMPRAAQQLCDGGERALGGVPAHDARSHPGQRAKEGQTDGHIDRQTDRHIDRLTHRPDRHKGRLSDRQTDLRAREKMVWQKVVDDDVGCQGSDHRQCTHHAMRVFPSDGCVCGARQEVTNEEAYDAEEAGLVFDISNTSANSPCSGLRLTFKGYDDKMPKLVSTILKLIGNLDFASPENQAVFDLVKEKTMTDYRNRRFQQPYHHGMTTAASLCEHPFWDREVCAILGLVRWRWCAGADAARVGMQERMAELETVTSKVRQLVSYAKEMPPLGVNAWEISTPACGPSIQGSRAAYQMPGGTQRNTDAWLWWGQDVNEFKKLYLSELLCEVM
eukprot:3213968-Rhodomonas_salina.1